jgi:hypothetical protein
MNRINTIEDVQQLNLPKISDVRGNITFIESGRPISFLIKRVYWIYDVPGGETRGGHAYQTLKELFIALSGSFNVVVDDGHNMKSVTLNRPYVGLYVPDMIWRRLENFSTNSVCLVLASLPYSTEEYIRDYGDYLHTINKNKDNHDSNNR